MTCWTILLAAEAAAEEAGQVDKLGEGHVVRVDLGVGNREHDGIGS